MPLKMTLVNVFTGNSLLSQLKHCNIFALFCYLPFCFSCAPAMGVLLTRTTYEPVQSRKPLCKSNQGRYFDTNSNHEQSFARHCAFLAAQEVHRHWRWVGETSMKKASSPSFHRGQHEHPAQAVLPCMAVVRFPQHCILFRLFKDAIYHLL